MEGTSSCINQQVDCWLLPSCLFPQNTENKLQLCQKHTRITHMHSTSLPKSARHIWWFWVHAHTHACLCLCVCALVWFVCLGRLKHYISHTHSHPQTETDKYTRSCTHCATFAIQHSVSQEYTHMHTKTTTHTHTHTIFPLLENRTFPASGREKCLDKLKTHTRTHNGTFSTHNVDIIFLSRALLSTSWPSEAAFLHWAVSGSKTGRLSVMSIQGWAQLKEKKGFNQISKTSIINFS